MGRARREIDDGDGPDAEPRAPRGPRAAGAGGSARQRKVGAMLAEARAEEAARAAPAPEAAPETEPEDARAHPWTRAFARGLLEDLQALRATVRESVLAGRMAIAIPAERIVDEAAGGGREDEGAGGDEESEGGGPGRGPMRGDPPPDDALSRLAADIARRGLRTPLRVRPLDPGWRPEAPPGDPLALPPRLRFAVMDGRCRLEACRIARVVPHALVSFGAPDPGRDGDGGSGPSSIHPPIPSPIAAPTARPAPETPCPGCSARCATRWRSWRRVWTRWRTGSPRGGRTSASGPRPNRRDGGSTPRDAGRRC